MSIAKELNTYDINRFMKLSNWKDGWKVIAPDFTSHVIRSYGMIHYEPYKIVTPEHDCGPLCVFLTRSDAEDFLLEHNSLLIIPCSYVPSLCLAVYIRHTGHVSYSKFPDGTILADAVILRPNFNFN